MTIFSATNVEDMRSERHFSPVSWMDTDNTTRAQPDSQQYLPHPHQQPEPASDPSKVVVEVLASTASADELVSPRDECPTELSTSDLGNTTGYKRALPEIQREQKAWASRYQQHYHRSLNHRHSYPKYDRHMLSERSMSVDNEHKRHTLASKSVDMDSEKLIEPRPYRRTASAALLPDLLCSRGVGEVQNIIKTFRGGERGH